MYFLVKICSLLYHIGMKNKCRILSILAIIAMAVISAICFYLAREKAKNVEVYADSVIFKTGARGFEVYIENSLTLNSNCVTIEPSNYTVKPTFYVSKYSSRNEMEEVKETCNFDTAGKYLITCKVPTSLTTYTSDTLLITVVNNPSSQTPVYIKAVKHEIYTGQAEEIDNIVDIKSPSNNITINSSNGLEVQNGYISSSSAGSKNLYVNAEYLNIQVNCRIEINVKEKQKEQLVLKSGGNVVKELILHNDDDVDMFTYQILNSKMQVITCEVDNDVVKIVSNNSPTILLKANKLGECTLKITLTSNPNIVFEVKIYVIN